MVSDLASTYWTCRCGDVSLAVAPNGGSRAVCYCESCRSFATALGHADILDDWGGTDLFQVAPEAVCIERGQSKIVWTRMTDKGPARWYTTCCHSPLANTLPTPAIPFVTLQTAFLEDTDKLGPVTMRVFRRFALGRVPDAPGGQGRLMWEFAKRAVKSRLSGGWRRNPLFDQTGKPIAAQTPMPKPDDPPSTV